MGIDAGFDMVPPLSRGSVDKEKWQSFMAEIMEYYRHDDHVELKPNYIEFKRGEHPLLPFEGHKLLRFSSKTSGSRGSEVIEYIDTVTALARTRFGSRVKPWDEGFDIYGHYSWNDVNDSLRTYEQRDEPDTPTSIVSNALQTNSSSESDPSLFDIQSFPNKGKGLVARQDIAVGTRILCEKPLLVTSNMAQAHVMEGIIATKLRALTREEQRQFFSLHNNFPGKFPFSGTVKTNALPCGPKSEIGGVYPTICLINHCCLPNAHNNWNSNQKWETIHAIRDIKAGEEITIPYEDGGPHDARQADLKKSFGFNCDCHLCRLSPIDLQKSDSRRIEIQSLDSAIGDGERVFTKPGDCLADCDRLRQVLEEEYQGHPGILISRLYYDAFQISITHGDQARASIFAQRAYESRMICEGGDSPETQQMKHLMEQPTTHRNFGMSKRWKTAKTMCPKGLDAKAFEKWLWRRKN